MRRRIALITLLLIVGGAIVNVAVAWGCVVAQFRPFFANNSWDDSGGLSEQERVELVSVGLTPKPPADNCFDFVFEVWLFYGFGWSERRVVETEEKRDDCTRPMSRFIGYEDVALFIHAGWPLPSLSGALYETTRPPQTISAAIKLGEKTTWSLDPMLLPYRPIWPGFAINTMFYAGLLWVVFFGPGKVRRTIRRRRGLCPACAYPNGSSPVCTECGHLLNGKGHTSRKGMGLPPPPAPCNPCFFVESRIIR